MCVCVGFYDGEMKKVAMVEVLKNKMTHTQGRQREQQAAKEAKKAERQAPAEQPSKRGLPDNHHKRLFYHHIIASAPPCFYYVCQLYS